MAVCTGTSSIITLKKASLNLGLEYFSLTSKTVYHIQTQYDEQARCPTLGTWE